MKKEIIFSGIQPSGNLHIGNYIGAISQWVAMQKNLNELDELMFCIVDLHAITVPQDPTTLREKIREIAAIYIASGIDPERSDVFVQSENHDHSYLGWIFNCIAPMGWLERMTQYKDKSKKQGERSSVGLFDYPALMAADILLYDTTKVPVGDDQKQHVELARDIAEKFNNIYGDIFVVPEPQIQQHTARIMSLQNPESKMSKSDSDPNGAIALLDSPDVILKKMKRAVTDSGTTINEDNLSPALENLISIYSIMTDQTFENAHHEVVGLMYGQFKQKLAESTIAKLEPIQKKYQELMTDKAQLDRYLNKGRDAVIERSTKKVDAVKKVMGLGR